MLICPLYFAGLALVYVFLSFRVIVRRRKFKVGVGDGDNAELRKAICAHANFAQYVPIAMILIYFVELEVKTAWLVHLICGLLLFGRVIHAYGISQVNEKFQWRVFGMICTFTSMLIAVKAIILARF